jgi:methionyl-tRNA formyltransferase
MKIVFLGSSDFAVPSLKALVENGYQVSCVVTQPDKRQGRGLRVSATAVKSAADTLGIKVYQPQDITCEESVKFLEGLGPELFVVVSYGQMLSERVLLIPKLFALNLHASLLPKYRGAAPINWALIKGEKETGLTIMKICRKLDSGPVIMRKKVKIEEGEDAKSLEDRLAQEGAKLLVLCVEKIIGEDYSLTVQNEPEATYAPKLKTMDGLVNWEKPASDILNLLKACFLRPGVITHYKGKLLKIHKARSGAPAPQRSSVIPGEILEVSREGIVVAAGEGNIVIEELQVEGGRRLIVEEFIAGHRIKAGDKLE